jgi:hypothetical protein
MEVTKPGGTREQTAVAAWFDRAELARSRLGSVAEQTPSLVPCFDIWASAVGRFGECELHARSLDRARALKVFKERRPWLTELVEERNEAGIEDLNRLRKTLPDLGSELAALELDQDRVAEMVDEAERWYRETLADWEMKGSDAKKLMDQFVQIGDVVRSDGLAALPGHLDKVFDELSEGRRRPDRGTYDNLPWWKWMIIAGMVGWWVAFLIVAAVYRGDQHALIWTGYAFIQVIHFVALVLFC